MSIDVDLDTFLRVATDEEARLAAENLRLRVELAAARATTAPVPGDAEDGETWSREPEPTAPRPLPAGVVGYRLGGPPGRRT